MPSIGLWEARSQREFDLAGVWLDWGPVRACRIDVLMLSCNSGTLRVYSCLVCMYYVLWSMETVSSGDFG